jgi:hypothetical protein
VQDDVTDLHNALDRNVANLRGDVRNTHSSKYLLLLYLPVRRWLTGFQLC